MSKFMEIVKQVGEELDRMNTLGRSEVANALFNGQAFVLYGDGQRSVENGKTIEPPNQPAIESPEQSPGMSM